MLNVISIGVLIVLKVVFFLLRPPPIPLSCYVFYSQFISRFLNKQSKVSGPPQERFKKYNYKF